MKRRTLFLGMISAIILAYSNSPANELGNNEIIIRLSGDFVKLPEGKTRANLKEVGVNSLSLQELFGNYGVEWIAKAYPDFTKKDTIITSAEGLQVRVGDLTKVFLLKFKEEEKVDQFLQQVKTPQSIERLTSLSNNLIQRKNLGRDDDVRKIADEIDKDPQIRGIIKQHNRYTEILLAEPNYPGQYFANPNDPCYPQQWGLQGGDAGISCNAAWDHYKGGNIRAIGILDSGLYPHRDLNFIGEQTNLYDHGTAVAGVVAATTDNGLDVAGVVWQHASSQLRSYRISAQEPNHPTAEEITNGINRAIGNCSIMNISSGTHGESIEMGIAMKNALSGDALVVCAAGKDGDATPVYPAVWGFSVGATDINGFWATYSNTSPDVVAPGGIGTSDYHDIMTLNTVDPWHTYYSGTSMAAPFVSGVAALISGYMFDSLGYFRVTRNDMQRILEITAKDIYPAGYDYQYGWGIINANNALDKILKTGSSRLKHLSVAGRDWEEQSDYYVMTLVDVPGLFTQTYIVKRYTCYKNVNWHHPCLEVPNVWVNGAYSQGYSYMNPQYGENWGALVDGSVTTTNATLKTNVYDIWDLAGSPCGWRPCQPSGVSFDYGVLGHFNMFAPYSATAQLIYDGGTDHYVRIQWSDTNEYHDGYQLCIEDNGSDTIELAKDCRLYNYHCPYGSSLVTAKIRPYIGDDYGPWSNVTTTRNAPNKPSNLRVHIKRVCGWPANAKIVPGQSPNGLPDEPLEESWVPAESSDTSLELTIAPGWNNDPPLFSD
ncbi:MAG: S8 family serine peptidase [Candidatus Zixiibacteriota bacterium]